MEELCTWHAHSASCLKACIVSSCEPATSLLANWLEDMPTPERILTLRRHRMLALESGRHTGQPKYQTLLKEP
jgi:hypothetical protein